MSDIPSAVLVLSILLALVALLQPVARALAVPHTVLLAGLGVGLGLLTAIASYVAVQMPFGGLVLTVDQFHLGDDAILYFFLPALLFQTGLGVDVRRALDEIAPILTLAVVAVIICTFAVGLALWPFAPFGLVVCLLLGAVVATTDPVAVIGIFRDLGAPRRLLVMVEGESLFNDAAAIVLFTVLLQILTRLEQPGWAEGILLFLTTMIGGAVVGYLGAWALALSFRLVRNLPLAEISLTVALPYFLFVVSERYLDVSGVVATVVAALVITSAGRTHMSPGTWSGLFTVWDQIGYWAASLIFLFAAIQVPILLGGASVQLIGLLAVLTIAAFAARAAVIWGLLPVLVRIGWSEPVDTPFKVVMFWGGLRGAVTLALALAVVDHPFLRPEVKTFVTVLATGFVLFTLLVNATTLRFVMRLWKLDKLPPTEAAIRHRAVGLARNEVQQRIDETARDYRIDNEHAADVRNLYANMEEDVAPAALEEAAQLRLGLLAISNREELLYRERFDEGRMSRRTFVTLTAKAERLSDAARGGTQQYLAAAADTTRSRSNTWLGARLHRLFGWQGFLSRTLADRFEQLSLTRQVLDDLTGLVARRLRPMLGNPTAEALLACLDERIESCDRELRALRRAYPEYSERLENRILRQAALRMEEAEYQSLLEEGLIGDEVYGDLDRGMREQWHKLGAPPQLDVGLDIHHLARGVPLFQGLSEERLKQVVKLFTPYFAYPGEELMRQGEPGKVMYFISSGEVEIIRGTQRFVLEKGKFFGEMALLHNSPRTATARAVAYSRLLSLSVRDFRRFLKSNPDLKEPITQEAERRLTIEEKQG